MPINSNPTHMCKIRIGLFHMIEFHQYPLSNSSHFRLLHIPFKIFLKKLFSEQTLLNQQ